MTQIFLCLYTEDEEEDEDNTEPKAGLESDQMEDEDSKDTKEGKMGLCMYCVCVRVQTFRENSLSSWNDEHTIPLSLEWFKPWEECC